MKSKIINFLKDQGLISVSEDSLVVNINDSNVDIVDLIQQFIEPEWDEDHALDTVLNNMVEDIDLKWVVEIKYENGQTENVELVTDDIDRSINQYSRNRDPFTWKVIETLIV